jgi:hypothetical protein
MQSCVEVVAVAVHSHVHELLLLLVCEHFHAFDLVSFSVEPYLSLLLLEKYSCYWKEIAEKYVYISEVMSYELARRLDQKVTYIIIHFGDIL